MPDNLKLDGVDLIPFLTKPSAGLPHAALFWRRGPSWAVREGDWKLVSFVGSEGGGRPELFNLAEDIGETSDRSKQERDRVKRMRNLFRAWSRSLRSPLWEGTTPGSKR